MLLFCKIYHIFLTSCSKKWDIQRPGKCSTEMWDKQAEKRDVPAKTGQVATLLPK